MGGRALDLEVDVGQAVAGRRLAVRLRACAPRSPVTVSGLAVTFERVVRAAHRTAVVRRVLWVPATDVLDARPLQGLDELETLEPGQERSWEVVLAAPAEPSVKALRPAAFEVEHRLTVTGRGSRRRTVGLVHYLSVGCARSLHSDVEGRVERAAVPGVRLLTAHAVPGGAVSVLAPDRVRLALLRREVAGGSTTRGRPVVRDRRYDPTSAVAGEPALLGVPPGATPTAVHPEGSVHWFVEAGRWPGPRTLVEVNVHTC